jgi:aminotransferase
MDPNGSKSPGDRIASHVSRIPRSGIRDFFEIVSTRKDIISLSIGEPNFISPSRIRKVAIDALESGAICYTANLGMLELREAASTYISNSIGVDYDPVTEVLITVGVSEAFDLAVRALVEPGDEVIYHEPCYVSYAPIVSLSAGVPVPVTTRAEDEFRMTPASLKAAITDKTKLLLLNFPTNPTGAVLTREDAEGIAQLVIEHDLTVITDEIYSELTYDGEHVSILSMPGMRERTILLNGLSKAWAMTGFRIGFACAPPELIEAMMKIHQYSIMCAPILGQKAGIEALTNGLGDSASMVAEYEERRNFICEALNGMGLKCHVPHGAFYAFPYIGDFGMSSAEFSLKLIDEENVACVPGTAFGASGEGFMRCSYATNLDEIKEAMIRIERFVKRLRG